MPKQFLDLEGRSILQRTIEKFVAACPDIRIVTVLSRSSVEYWKERCIRDNFIIPQIIAEGGITRFHSVRNALSKVPDDAIVAIHDGVRPLVSVSLIREMFSRMEDGGGISSLVPVAPMVDTLKILERGSDGTLSLSEGSADRSKVFGAQTPQMFISSQIKEAYGQAYDTSFTDDASVFSAKGKPLSFIYGERFNIKITTPEDLFLARAVFNYSK